jgi:hypothetical protein
MFTALKKTPVLLLFAFLNSHACFCQLLSNPSVTVEDIEMSLTNPKHLSEILKEQNFENSATGASDFNASGAMSNTLYPDLRILKSENWLPKDPQDQYLFIVSLIEWEPNHAPHPDVIKTIRIMVKKDSKYAEQLKAFLEIVKNKYPNKSKRYFQYNEFYKQFGEPLVVFTNDSKIEVRTEEPDARYIHFYTVSFDLVR